LSERQRGENNRDRADIALAIKGVHLDQNDFAMATRQKKILGGKRLSVSPHNLEQAVAAIKLPIDYVAIPVPFTRRAPKEIRKNSGRRRR